MNDNRTDEWVQGEDRVQAHYSSLSLHRKCPEAWYFRYGLGLKSNVVEVAAPERDFGSWWSAMQAAESLERGRKWGSLIPAGLRPFSAVERDVKFDPETVTVKEVFAAAKAWWSKQTPEAVDEWQSRLGDSLPGRLKSALIRWMDEWSHERQVERPLGVELFWERELPRPEGDSRWDEEAGQLKLNLIGFIDELYYDSEKDMIVVRDSKTAKSLGTQSALDDMMDSQLQLYPWGITPWLAQQGYPAPKAVAYDRVRSVKPRTPSLTTAGKLGTYKGEPALATVDLRTYVEWAKGPDGEGIPWRGPKIPRKDEYKPGGVYVAEESVIERLSTKSHRAIFHQRTLVPISPHIVRAHLRSAVDTATDIWRSQKRAALTGDAARNLSKGACQYCDYVLLCRARMFGGPEGEYDLSEMKLQSKKGDLLTPNGIVESAARPMTTSAIDPAFA